MTPPLTTDIVIVGAGMVGAAAALALAGTGYRVTLVDSASKVSWEPAQYALRVSAISPASQQLLSAVGAWRAIAERRVSPYERMVVWDAGGDGELRFDAADAGQPYLGHIIENDLINAQLLERARSHGDIRILQPAIVERISWQHQHVSVQLDDGRCIHAQLLVGADGASSQVRRAAGIATRGHSYQQSGIVAVVQTGKSHQRTAWQRFLATGPLAFLPLADGSCSIVWSADTPLAEQLMALDDQQFAARLCEAFDGRLGEVQMLSQRAAFPLSLANAERYTDERLVLIGDAAHRVHPLAGQGVNLGFGDVTELAAMLLDNRRQGRDAGDAQMLRKYARARRAEATAMLLAMDGIQRVFGSPAPAMRKLRSLALDLVDRSAPLRQFFVNQATGLGGKQQMAARHDN